MVAARQPHLVLCELGPPVAGLESLSPFCLKAHRALKFHGLEYESRHGSRPSAHKAHNPSGQVPVLLINDTPVPDSTAILSALEALTNKSLVPDDPREQANAWLWEDYADRVLGYYVFAARWFDDRNWAPMLDEQFRSLPGWLKPWLPNYVRKRVVKGVSNMEFIRAGQDGCWQMYIDHLNKLEQRAPETGFWVGPMLTVADVSLFGMLHCLRSTMSPWQMEQIQRRQRLSAWLDRVDELTRGT